jgi:aspartyl-tRNA(Asn)/glutamyl-tRNA(Gln) amidotransferase subunit B
LTLGPALISSTGAKQLLLDIAGNSGDVVSLISERGLAQISDEGDLKLSVSDIIAKFPEQLADYRGGKTKIRQFFFGEVMKVTKGKANPGVINKLLDELLSG